MAGQMSIVDSNDRLVSLPHFQGIIGEYYLIHFFIDAMHYLQGISYAIGRCIFADTWLHPTSK